MFNDVWLVELQESSIWNKTCFIFIIMTSLLPFLLPLLRLHALCLIIEILIGFLGEQSHWEYSSFIAVTAHYVQGFLLIFWSISQLLIPQIFFLLVEGPLEDSALNIPSNSKDIWAAVRRVLYPIICKLLADMILWSKWKTYFSHFLYW